MIARHNKEFSMNKTEIAKRITAENKDEKVSQINLRSFAVSYVVDRKSSKVRPVEDKK